MELNKCRKCLKHILSVKLFALQFGNFKFHLAKVSKLNTHKKANITGVISYNVQECALLSKISHEYMRRKFLTH